LSLTKPRPRRLHLHIRPAELEDLDHCLELEGAYTTDTVWQLYFDPGAGVTGVSARFAAVRLPRPVKVPYPRDAQELLGNWQQQDGFLVATTGTAEVGNERIIGYIDVHLQRWQKTGWVQNFIVTPDLRRKGVGSALFTAAAAWGRRENLARLIFETPTKNIGALRFYHAQGAEFCGFNDRYYTNGDVAVFFEYRL
jgi:GNAT superfamily N-acetyltransferase